MELAPTRLWWSLICVGDAWPLKGSDTDGHAIKPSLKNILNCYHIHGQGYMHRDIKPENIMLSGYWKACLAKIKLICFSICTCIKKFSKL